MIVVADASPLIFLAKIHQLDLIAALFPGEMIVPDVVGDEVLARPIPPHEQRLLAAFLQKCSIVRVARPRSFAQAMSDGDNAALTAGIRRHADLLLADDRLVRRMAQIENVRPMGTLGILIRAMKQKLLESAATREAIRTLIRSHGFRISVQVFEAVLSQIDEFEDPSQ